MSAAGLGGDSRSGVEAAQTGGEAGIRTLGRAFRPYNGLANRRLQPLGHLTAHLQVYVTKILTRKLRQRSSGRRPPSKPSPLTLNATTRGLCIVACYSFWAQAPALFLAQRLHIVNEAPGSTPGVPGVGSLFGPLDRSRPGGQRRRVAVLDARDRRERARERRTSGASLHSTAREAADVAGVDDRTIASMSAPLRTQRRRSWTGPCGPRSTVRSAEPLSECLDDTTRSDHQSNSLWRKDSVACRVGSRFTCDK
jgi:hypothetical protein